jgi:hypothetical protein
VVVTVPLGGGGGGGGHTADLDSGESGLAFLAPILGARVPVGRPHGSIRIRAVYLHDGLAGVDSGTGMTSTSSSSLSTTVTTTTSSSSSSATPPPSPSHGDVNTGYPCATRYGTGPCHGWRKAVPSDPMESRPDLSFPSASRPVVQGEETMALE